MLSKLLFTQEAPQEENWVDSLELGVPQNKATSTVSAEDWSSLSEGELVLDVYERPDALVVRSLLAGVQPEDIDISLNEDMLTIRGTRHVSEEVQQDQFYHQECYWGDFSRTIILPQQVQENKIKALFKNGVLMVILPKAYESNIPLTTEEYYLEDDEL